MTVCIRLEPSRFEKVNVKILDAARMENGAKYLDVVACHRFPVVVLNINIKEMSSIVCGNLNHASTGPD